MLIPGHLSPVCLFPLPFPTFPYFHSPSAPDNASFASCGGDKAVLVWDVSSGTILRRLQGHFGKVNVVKFGGGGSGGGGKDPGGNVLFTGSFDSKVMIWDMR